MIYEKAKLYNVTELVEDGKGGNRLLRLPMKLVKQLNPNAQRSVYYSCGCEVRFNLHSEEAVIYLSRDSCGSDIMPYGVAEVWQGDHQGRYQLSPQPVGQHKTAIRIRKMGTEELKPLENEKKLFDPELYRVFLPYDWGTSIHGIEGDITPPGKDQVPDETLLCYGSSITHGGGASVPTGSYALRLARSLGMDLKNLGLAGAAWMDEGMADYICEHNEWSTAVLELGINVLHWSLGEFEDRARSFIRRIALSNPEKPIYCISPFTSIEDYKRREHIRGMRWSLHKIVKELDLEQLHYIDGKDCLTDLSGLSSDGLHPSNLGMEEISRKIYNKITQS